MDDPATTPAAAGTGPVFICHASADAGVARRVAESLEARGVGCWIAPRDIPLGIKYADAIVQGIHDCAGMVVLVSGAANASSFVHREVERADSQRKLLVACLLEDVRPEKGLELFLSATQHVDANRAGLDAAIDAIAATFRAHVPGVPPPATARADRRRPAWLAGLGALTLVLAVVLVADWRPWPVDPEPPVPVEMPPTDPLGDETESDAADPDDGVPIDADPGTPTAPAPTAPVVDTAAAAARAVMAAAHDGDPLHLRSLFTRQAEAMLSENQWSALAAQARVAFDGAAAAEAPFVIDRPLPRRAAMMGPGTYAMLLAERPLDGGHMCEQVVVRREAPDRWAATSYLYWKAVDGRCPGEADLRAATERAHAILEALQTTGAVAASDLATTMQGVAGTADWQNYLQTLQPMLSGWSSRDHVVAAGPLPGVLPMPTGPGIPGRFISVRFAVDNGGTQRNLDLTLQYGADGDWRLAGIFIAPWQA